MAIGPEQENTGLFYVEAGSVRSEKYILRYMLRSIIGILRCIPRVLGVVHWEMARSVSRLPLGRNADQRYSSSTSTRKFLDHIVSYVRKFSQFTLGFPEMYISFPNFEGERPLVTPYRKGL